MEHLRIALLSSHSCPWAKPGNRYTGGMNIYIQNLAAELARRGHIVDIYTASHVADEQCTAAELTSGIQLIHINAADFNSLSEANAHSNVSDFAAAIVQYCRETDSHYDLVHSHYWLSGLIGNALSKSWGIPHITMFHTLAKLKNKAGISTLEPEFRASYEKRVIDNCNLIIASIDKEKCELVQQYGAIPDKISVIPCGINTSLFRPVNKSIARAACKLDSKQTILFVGRMDPLKGLANLLHAVSILQTQRDFQLLVIGGDGDNDVEYQRMLNLIIEYKIDGIAVPLGSIPHEKMYLYYNAADFCIIPSYYESFSLVALESLACSTPILATAVGEISDMIKPYVDCRIMLDNTPSTIASHIDEALALEIGEIQINNRMLASRYGWDSVTEKILNAYNRVLSPIKVSGKTPLKV